MDGENYAPLLATITKMTSIKLVRLLKKNPKTTKMEKRDRCCVMKREYPPTHPPKFSRYVCAGLWLRSERDYQRPTLDASDLCRMLLRCLDAAAAAVLLRLFGPDRRAAPCEALDHCG